VEEPRHRALSAPTCPLVIVMMALAYVEADTGSTGSGSGLYSGWSYSTARDCAGRAASSVWSKHGGTVGAPPPREMLAHVSKKCAAPRASTIEWCIAWPSTTPPHRRRVICTNSRAHGGFGAGVGGTSRSRISPHGTNSFISSSSA
jgi:hypothetical protein